jgi:hypothetical protein
MGAENYFQAISLKHGLQELEGTGKEFKLKPDI